MPVVAQQRAASALRFLPQKTTGMEPFHAANFRAVIADYIDYVERDDVLSHVVTAIRRRATRTARDWNDESLKNSAATPLPADGVACLALRYDLLRTAVKSDKFDLRYFVTCLFPGSHLNEKLMHWKRLVVHPLAQDLRRLGEIALEGLPATEWVETDDFVLPALDALSPQAFGPRSWTDADDDATTKAEEQAKAAAKRSALAATTPTSPASPSSTTMSSPEASARPTPSPGPPTSTTKSAWEAPASHPVSPGTPTPTNAPSSPESSLPEALGSALTALRRAIEAAPTFTPDDRHDLGLDVAILALELRKVLPAARARIDSRLHKLARLAALEGPVALVRGQLGPAP